MNPSTSLPSTAPGASVRAGWQGVIEAYRAYLPVAPKTPVVSLLEGNTPLIPSPRLSEKAGRGCKVYLKYEGLNPTASFKDRGMTVALSLAVERGARNVICASTGNTSASAAAYAARAGIRCIVLLPEGKVSKGKLAQAMLYGATCLSIEGSFDEALRLVRELGADRNFAVVNSINPDRIEGQKTAAFEIIDALGEAPDFHFLPVGNAGNIAACWKGYNEWKHAGRSIKLPRMIGFQASGAAPIVRNAVVEKPKTVATAIQIGNPASWKSAVAARDESHGLIDEVTDEEILAAQRWLASNEGIFAEPASAASVAGLLKCLSAKSKSTSTVQFSERSTIVCTLTGHGLKDPDAAIANSGEMVRCAPTLDAVMKAIQ